jgi:hypothetical protein
LVVQIIREGQRDLSRPLALPQPPLDLLLGRYKDSDIPFYERLAGQRITGCHIIGGEALGRATADCSLLNDDRTTTAPALTTAGHQDVYSSLLGSVAQKRAYGHLHVPTSRLKLNGNGTDDDTSCL